MASVSTLMPQDSVYAYGLWLHSGQPERRIALVINEMQRMIPKTPWTLVSFGAGAMSANNAHGSAVFLLNGEKYEQCTISFHCSGSTSEIVSSKTLIHQGHGIWTENEKRKESLILLWVSPSHGLYAQWQADVEEKLDVIGLLEGKNPGFSMSEIKGVLRYFLPGHGITPTRVLLRLDNRINFVTTQHIIQEASGMWSWILLANQREGLSTWFNSLAKEDFFGYHPADQMVFEKIGEWSSTGRHIEEAVPIAAGLNQFLF